MPEGNDATERFAVHGDTATDTRTGLEWPLDAQAAETGLSWPEALELVAELNERAAWGHADWRLPNRRELHSLVDHSRRQPALPAGHPFRNVWNGRYWTSTSFARSPAHAWWVQMSGGRMFYAAKTDDAVVWPVRGESSVLHRTGQRLCHDARGREIACAGTGQDAALAMGLPWPEPRFAEAQDGVLDRLGGLVWTRGADLAHGPVDWETAQEIVHALPAPEGRGWRLPGIMELESLTDCSRADPALPGGHPFEDVREAYWSATTSGFDPDWAFCLYMHKGAVGVGFKPGKEFHVWAVRPA